ncbi:hypothetical protein Tco_0104388 [Tanacetum coccineum]
MTFGGNTRDLHQIHEEILFLERGDGVAGIKRCCPDPFSNGVRDLVTASGPGRLNEDLESSTDQVSILAKDKRFGQEMHQSEETKALYGVTSPKDYAVTYSNEEMSHYILYGVKCLQDYAATFKYTRDDVSDSALRRNICDRRLSTPSAGLTIAGIKRRCRDPFSDSVRDLVMTSGPVRLNEDLESTTDQVSILAKDKRFGQEMHQSEVTKALYGVTSPKDYAVTYSNEEMSHHILYGVKCLQDYAATFKYTRDDVSDSALRRNICDRVTL